MITPRRHWKVGDVVLKEDLNRIESNIELLAGREATLKLALVNALIGMGQTASISDSFETLSNKVKSISNDANAQAEHVLQGKTFYSGGQKRTGVWPGPMFGDGSLGHFDSTQAEWVECGIGDLVVLDYKSFKLNVGNNFLTLNPVRALIIRSWGDIIINGTVKLDNRGGFGERYITIGGIEYDLLGGFGGNGGNGDSLGYTSPGDNRSSSGGVEDSGHRVAGGLLGGGGGGGGPYGGDGGKKNANYMKYGGGGGGGVMEWDWQWGFHPGSPGTNGGGGGGGAEVWEAGGSGYIRAGTGGDVGGLVVSGVSIMNGGAGGGGGGIVTERLIGGAAASPGWKGDLGGGVLILIAGGSIIINGGISARGGQGGRGGDTYLGSSYYYGGGGGGAGGSGGGRVIALHRGSYANYGTIDLSGGAGGLPGWSYIEGISHIAATQGSSGGTGSVQIKKL